MDSGRTSPFHHLAPWQKAAFTASIRFSHLPVKSTLDPLGDHCAACSRAGRLRSRGVPLERAAARVCREARATVATNFLLRDFNVITQRHGDRRLEVIANGLPLWGVVQLYYALSFMLRSRLTTLHFVYCRNAPETS